ncbi:hypothetical protein H4219_001735 [Mycoemilia scoparia]|uniref:Uncharacterized protein n=1 Tax=Mycoemilia scoparia TaxID=417184 RepID=A0A9W7ZZM6_9FUNG|nr:hypothetical protein H4219_001735 [Mycoemilia scoparia]
MALMSKTRSSSSSTFSASSTDSLLSHFKFLKRKKSRESTSTSISTDMTKERRGTMPNYLSSTYSDSSSHTFLGQEEKSKKLSPPRHSLAEDREKYREISESTERLDSLNRTIDLQFKANAHNGYLSQRVVLSKQQTNTMNIAKLSSCINRMSRFRYTNQECKSPSTQQAEAIEKLLESMERLNKPALDSQRYVPRQKRAVTTASVLTPPPQTRLAGSRAAVTTATSPLPHVPVRH